VYFVISTVFQDKIKGEKVSIKPGQPQFPENAGAPDRP
jgi:hypothetical protein